MTPSALRADCPACSASQRQGIRRVCAGPARLIRRCIRAIPRRGRMGPQNVFPRRNCGMLRAAADRWKEFRRFHRQASSSAGARCRGLRGHPPLRVSNIEQRQHCESRIFLFFRPASQSLGSVLALAWLHEGSKRGIGDRNFIPSDGFLLALLSDSPGWDFRISVPQRLGSVTHAG